LDPEQNIEVLGGRESEGWTVIRFRRQLAACETTHDKEITVTNKSLQPCSEFECVKFPQHFVRKVIDMQRFV